MLRFIIRPIIIFIILEVLSIILLDFHNTSDFIYNSMFCVIIVVAIEDSISRNGKNDDNAK